MMDTMYSNDDIKNEIDDVWSQNEQIIKIMTEMNAKIDSLKSENAVMKKNESLAKVQHTKLAFTNYQNMTRQGDDTFVGIIFMSGAKKWSNVVSNVDELVQNLAVGTIYVASPDQADLFPQTTYKF